MKRVIIESPDAAANGHTVEEHEAYARRCMADSLARGEAPFASHLLYTQPGVLQDEIPTEREIGIEAGQAWLEVADLVAAYVDFGISGGMRWGMTAAAEAGVKVVRRSLDSQNPNARGAGA